MIMVHLVRFRALSGPSCYLVCAVSENKNTRLPSIKQNDLSGKRNTVVRLKCGYWKSLVCRPRPKNESAAVQHSLSGVSLTLLANASN